MIKLKNNKNNYKNNYTKSKGTVLLLSLFLILFTVTIVAISYLYVRNAVREIEISELETYIIPMYEIYTAKLIELVNNHVYQTEENNFFTDKINFIFIPNPYNYQEKIDSINTNTIPPYLGSDINRIESLLGNTNKIEMGEIDSEGKLKINFVIENQVQHSSQTTRTLTLDMNQVLDRRREYIDSFGLGEEEIRGYAEEYVRYIQGESLNSFIKGFKEYKDRLKTETKISKITIRQVRTKYWEIYVPYSIVYKYQMGKEERKVVRDHKLVMYMKPYYLISVTTKVTKNLNKLEIVVRGIGSLNVEKIIRKY